MWGVEDTNIYVSLYSLLMVLLFFCASKLFSVFNNKTTAHVLRMGQVENKNLKKKKKNFFLSSSRPKADGWGAHKEVKVIFIIWQTKRNIFYILFHTCECAYMYVSCMYLFWDLIRKSFFIGWLVGIK